MKPPHTLYITCVRGSHTFAHGRSNSASPDDSPDRPLVLVVHGLMGHSEETYVRQCCSEICVKDHRHPLVVAMNYRGAFMNKLTTTSNKGIGGGYSIYDTLDIGLLISHLRETHHGPLFVVGFSMGAAKLCNFLGRTGAKSNIDGAVCICCPWDFTAKNEAVHAPNFTETCYHFILANAIKLWVIMHYSALSQNQKLAKKSPAFRRTRSGLLWWMQTHDMVSFDASFTINWLGYDSVEEYYEAASPNVQVRR